MPKISIVLPTYNGAEYLAQSIESVIGQTFQDWELIIVNDSSTDNTLSIANTYASKDDRIRVITNAVNKKLPESLNVGFREAKGEYLTWTSDDNYYLPDALMEMNDYLDGNEDIVMVCAKIVFIDERDNRLDMDIAYNHTLMFYNDCVGACFMYRREVLHTVGEYDLDYFCVEDYEYWLRIIREYGRIEYIDKVLYMYRLQPNSLTVTKMDKVKSQLNRMRIANIDFLLEGLKGRYNYIVMLYCELYRASCMSETIRNKFTDACMELKYVSEVKADIPIILYGSGNEGTKAYERYGDLVQFFADGNENKVGTYKHGKKIISVEEMIEKSKDYQIVVSVGDKLKYDLMRILNDMCVSEYALFFG